MARANRHYIPGCVWHITHRCHKKEFLLKFDRDKKAWMHWLFEAKKRFGLQILNYIVTNNHVHLLVVDNGEDVIPSSIQLIAGRTAQEYNMRKGRHGAYWEDRYHATAVEANEHLIQCIAYIDLNMVRAGIVKDVGEWQYGGYNEIQNPKERYSLINLKLLADLFDFGSKRELQEKHKELVEDILRSKKSNREERWTESVAVGSSNFIKDIKEKLGFRVLGRKAIEEDRSFILKEPESSYNDVFGTENGHLREENTYFWDYNHCDAII